MFHKRLYCAVIVMLCVLVTASSLYAAVASPRAHELVQPDGSVVNARQWGDEWLHGWETVEGYAIVKNSAGFWVYAGKDATGKLFPTKVKADSPVPEKIQGFLRPGGEEIRKALKKRRKVSVKVVPSTGTAKIPFLLINYNDTTPTNTPAEFESLLFDTNPAIASGPGSMNDYYREVSYGAFSVSSGPSGVSGWHTAAAGHNYYGQNDSSGYDMYPAQLVKEAVQAADAAGFDFSQYDNDGDGKVDVVNVIHQGSGEEESGVSNDIWSHRWTLTSAGVGSVSADGVTIDDYTIQPERLSGGGMVTIGVISHEFGHALGLPDLYDTDYSSRGIGYWGLMASGSYNAITNDGDCPAHINAWCKYSLGWVTPTVVVGTLPNEQIDEAATTADVYQLVGGTPTSGEYFLVENRQMTGFDQGLPGTGLLVWHVDGNVISTNFSSNSVNDSECYPGGPSCATNHYGVALVQADNGWGLEKKINKGDDGDPYPGRTNNTSLTGGTAPDTKFYNGSASTASVTDISGSDNQMTATLSVDDSVTTTTAPSTTTTTGDGGCPPDYPIDCGNGYCCPQTHPVCGYGPDEGWCFTDDGPQTTTTTVGSGDCPPDYPIDCGNGWCCPESHPTCGYGTDEGLCFTDDMQTTTTTVGSGDCPPDYPIDCGNGWCCPLSHPTCGYGADEGTCFTDDTLTTTTSIRDDDVTTTIPEDGCTADRPIDCGNGYCCPLTAPFCNYQSLGECTQCPADFALDSDETKLGVLRGVRDARMSGSCQGKSMIDLYYEHAQEVSGILSAHGNLKAMTANVAGEIAEEAAAAGNDTEWGLTQELIASVLELADEISVRASPELKKAIKKVKQEIKKGDLFSQMGIKVE